MERLPAQRRPHYPAIERLAILELRAARGWSQAETARCLLVTPLTVASWTQRLDDEGPDALVQVREPVNRFPEPGFGSPGVTQFETVPNWLAAGEPLPLSTQSSRSRRFASSPDCGDGS